MVVVMGRMLFNGRWCDVGSLIFVPARGNTGIRPETRLPRRTVREGGTFGTAATSPASGRPIARAQ
jgi:hypothetical protein